MTQRKVKLSVEFNINIRNGYVLEKGEIGRLRNDIKTFIAENGCLCIRSKDWDSEASFTSIKVTSIKVKEKR